MERLSYSVIFYAKKSKMKKNGKLPIYGRITINGVRSEFVVQSEVDEAEWDNERGCAKGKTKESKLLNSYLELQRVKIRDAKIQMEEQKLEITSSTLREKYLGREEKKITILELFDDHNDKCKKMINIDFAPGTVERYITCRKHLADFMASNYKKTDFEIDNINPMFISDFELYLKYNRKCCHNTATKYIKNFKKIVRIALANGFITKDPFANVKFRLDDVDMAYLTKDELETIRNKDFYFDRLNQVRDVYLFCCFTGLAFIDVKTLTPSEIKNKDGKMWIEKKRQKTKSICTIPILPAAVEILNKYQNHPTCLKNGLVLPVNSNQRMNSYLKEIADLCGIEKNLSTHTARHTFATTVTLSNQVSIEVVSKMLGHSSINMTKRYARVVDTLISKDMEKVYAIY